MTMTVSFVWVDKPGSPAPLVPCCERTEWN